MRLTAQFPSLQMEWCLACHRNPEKFLRPKDKIFDLAWVAADQETLGERARETEPSPVDGRAHELQHVSSMKKLDGPDFWRSLEEYAETPEFSEMLGREFPRYASEWDATTTASAAAASSSSRAPRSPSPASRRVRETATRGPRPVREAARGAGPGPPSLLRDRLHARGLRHRHPRREQHGPPHEGRRQSRSIPRASARRTSSRRPRSSRSTTPTARRRSRSSARSARGRPSPRSFRRASRRSRAIGGEGFRLLTPTVTSPALAAKIGELLAILPKARWHQWEPAGRDAVRAGARLAFGQPVETRYDFGKADVVVSLDADPFTFGPGSLVYARAFARRRREAATGVRRPSALLRDRDDAHELRGARRPPDLPEAVRAPRRGRRAVRRGRRGRRGPRIRASRGSPRARPTSRRTPAAVS